MSKFQIIHFPYFKDPRGETIPVEFDSDFPFEPKRSYFVTGNPGETRGGHAHLIEEEVFVVVSGSVKAIIDDGSGEQEIILDAKDKGLYVAKMVWHEFVDFTEDAVMVCFSSTHYLPGEQNYIMNKDEFLKQKHGNI